MWLRLRYKLFWCVKVYCVFAAVYLFLSICLNILSKNWFAKGDDDDDDDYSLLKKRSLTFKGQVTALIHQPCYSNYNITNSSVKDDVYPHPLDPSFPLQGQLYNPKPRFQLGQIELYADIIIGITTVKRDNADYLIRSINSLLGNREDDGVVVKLVVFIGETDLNFIQEESENISRLFYEEIRSGIIQVISPPENYYPKWQDALRKNHNDSLERVKWRSKQNLDQIFLMLYVYHLSPTYYLMMEDDVIASKGYVKKMISMARAMKKGVYKEWNYISFCSLGAIGKLFKTSFLPSYAAFIHMFWNKKPLDWLLVDYIRVAYCSHEEDAIKCKKKARYKTPFIAPALFQHEGEISSLKGKIQSLKDHTFKKTNKELHIISQKKNMEQHS